MAIVVSFVAASPEYSQVQYPLRSCRYEVYQSHPPWALPGMIGSCLKRLGGTCPQTQNERLQQPIHPKLPFSHPAKPSCWSVKYLVHSGKTLEKVLSKATGIFKLAIGIETTMPHRTGCRGRYWDSLLQVLLFIVIVLAICGSG